MNETSAFPAEPSTSQAAARGVLVWDFPVRVFHWLLALNFAIAWLTAESETWRLVHVIAGYTVAGLVAFRLAVGPGRHPPCALCAISCAARGRRSRT